MKRSKIEHKLADIWSKWFHTNDLSQLCQFLYKKMDKMTWDDWSYVYINFRLPQSVARQFIGYLDIRFIYEMALQDWVDTDINLMREFRYELEGLWGEKRK